MASNSCIEKPYSTCLTFHRQEHWERDKRASLDLDEVRTGISLLRKVQTFTSRTPSSSLDCQIQVEEMINLLQERTKKYENESKPETFSL